MPDDFSPVAAREPVKVTPPKERLNLLSTYLTARRNVLEIVPEAAYREPMIHKRGFQPWRMLMDPDAIEHVIKTRAKDYPRGDVALRILRPDEGENLFTAPWDDWRWQHRALTPIFQHKNLMTLTASFTSSAEAAAGRLAARSGETFDVYEEMITATFDVINDAALSGRERFDRDVVSSALTHFIESVAKLSILDVLGAPNWIPRPAKLFNPGLKTLDHIVDEVIAQRIARGPSEKPDLLDLLIAAEDPESGRKMSPAEIRNNLLVFIIAGHETTALALTWALYLVSLDRATQLKARAIAQDVLGDGPATGEHLAELGYIRQIVDEALRLYPPAGVITRTAKIEDDVILDLPVQRGESIIIPIYTLHRHQLLWDEPDAFAPERFERDAVKARHRYAYMPFGGGPRICIGMSFALHEATIILATLLARCDFALARETTPEPVLLATLRPKAGMPLTVSRL